LFYLINATEDPEVSVMPQRLPMLHDTKQVLIYTNIQSKPTGKYVATYVSEKRL